MKMIIESLVPVLESAINESIKNHKSNSEGNSLTDLYMRYDPNNEALLIFDDIENILWESNLEIDKNTRPDLFEKRLNNTAKHVLKKLEQEKFFEDSHFVKPFAVSMIDEDFIISEELIFIDDDTLKLDGDIFANLDKELDEFLKQLMK